MNVLSRVAVVVLVTFGCVGQVHADEWYEVTIYACDQKSNVLRITHVGAYNEHGLTLLQEHGGRENLSRPVGENDTAGEDWRVVRQCRLGTQVFEIEMTPGIKYRGDGECGAWSTNQLRISTGGRDLLKRLMQPWCSSDEIISEIVVDGSTARVDVTMKTGSEYYQ